MTQVDLGETISVTVTGSKEFFVPASKTSAAIEVLSQVNLTVNGVIYTMDAFGNAYVSGHTGDLPTSIVILPQVTIAGVNLTVTSIGESAFSYTPLVSVTIPDSVTSLGDGAFQGTNLVSVVIPRSITNLGKAVFRECAHLSSVTIPDTVESIGEQVFYGATALAKISIPSSVVSIGGYAFLGTKIGRAHV